VDAQTAATHATPTATARLRRVAPCASEAAESAAIATCRDGSAFPGPSAARSAPSASRAGREPRTGAARGTSVGTSTNAAPEIARATANAVTSRRSAARVGAASTAASVAGRTVTYTAIASAWTAARSTASRGTTRRPTGQAGHRLRRPSAGQPAAR
jgi:hypothetical protein